MKVRLSSRQEELSIPARKTCVKGNEPDSYIREAKWNSVSYAFVTVLAVMKAFFVYSERKHYVFQKYKRGYCVNTCP